MSRHSDAVTVTGVEPFDDLLDRWSTAERHADVAALDGLLDEEFRADGPGGHVLGKAAWLELHRRAELRCAALAWRPVQTRVDGAVAVAVGVRSQVARHAGLDWSGTFVCTVVAVRRARGWRLVNVQLSDRLNAVQPPRGVEIDQVADVLRTALYERGGHGKHP